MFRLIARLDIKSGNVIKGVRMEGLRVMGSPADFAKRYDRALWELLYIDTVASLYGRNHLTDILDDAARRTYIPIVAGGGVKSLHDVQHLFNHGADCVFVNTAAIKRPSLIDEISSRYGSQAICVSVEAKRQEKGWEAYTDNGRERTERDAVKWVSEAVARGAGGILLTSVDMDGTRKGFDLRLIEACADIPVQLIASGGCGSVEHIRQARDAGATGVAIGTALHYGLLTQEEIEHGLAESEFQAAGRSAEGRNAA